MLLNNDLKIPARTHVGQLNLRKGFKYESQDVSDYDVSKPTTPNLDAEVEKNLNIKLPTGKLDKAAEIDFISSLDDDGIIALGTLTQQGYSYNAAKALYENKDKYKDITAEGVSKYSRKENLLDKAADVGVGILQSPGKRGYNMVGQWMDRAGKALADKLQGTELANFIQQSAIDLFGEDEVRAFAEQRQKELAEGTAFNGREQTDIRTPLLGEERANNVYTRAGEVIGDIGTAIALSYPMASAAAPALANSTLLGKTILGASQGALDMAAYDYGTTGEAPTPGSMAMGAVLGGAAPILGAGYKGLKGLIKSGSKKAAAKLELSGLINPGKLDNIKNSLINDGTDIASAGLKGGTAEDVGTWMVERGFKGGKTDIVNQLNEYSSKARKMKLDNLAISKTTHNVDSANTILDTMHESVSKVPGLENLTKRIEGLMANKGKHTLSQLDEIKTISDEVFDLFKENGELMAGLQKKGLGNLRADLRKYIEDTAKAEKLGDMRMLNNEISVSKSLAKGISKKDSADQAREIVSLFGPYIAGGGFGAAGIGPFDSSSVTGRIGNMIVGAVAGRYLFSTEAKTALASKLNKLSGGTKKELDRLVAGEITKLSKKTESELLKALEDVEALPVLAGDALSQEEAIAVANYVQKSLF